MAFQPQIPFTGLTGWRFLQRTQANQETAFAQGPQLVRDVAYFKENIGKIDNAADLVADRRLFKIALGAFGLEGEIDKQAFIRKVLDEGSYDPAAFANRLSAPAYKKLAKAFGFGDPAGSRTGDTFFGENITAAYKTRAFEVAVGESNNNLRFAMNFRREMTELSKGETGGSWFSVLGSTPLRKVMESAFNLPTSFGGLDIDRQREILRDKSSAMFGTADLSAYADPANVEKVIERFLIRAQIDEGPSGNTRGSTALTLLQSATGGGSQGLFNLLATLR